MIRNLSLAPFFVVACSLLAPSEAQAQYGWGGYGNGYNNVGVYSIYDQDRLPYFALHPPVYYSRAVPRTFGYSPFAYPGWVPTPALAPVGMPEMVVNPFMNQLPEASSDANAPAPTTAPPAAGPPAPNSPTLKAGPLQGFKPPRANQKGFGTAPKGDKSASAAPTPKPLRIMNPHFDRRVVNVSTVKVAE